MKAASAAVKLFSIAVICTAVIICGCGSSSGGKGNNTVPLQAGVASGVITPTPENHQETVYLAGVVPSRVGTGVHDELKASVLALKQGEEHVVIVSLDLVGFTSTRGKEIRQRLQDDLGLDKDRILISATHTHEAPDVIGVYGPNVLKSGVSPTYMTFVQDTVTATVKQAWGNMVPVTMMAATAAVNDTGSNHPTLINDLRIPNVTVNHVSAAAFIKLDGKALATLVNWHSHPEVMIANTLVSSDFPHYLRSRMEAMNGGTCVYITGAVGGLSTPTDASVPARDEAGNPVLDSGGRQQYLLDPGWDKTRSLGFVIAEKATAALQAANAVAGPKLAFSRTDFPVPLRNKTLQIAVSAGLVQYDKNDLITDGPARCREFGCAPEQIALVRVGNTAILTSPGETFPETIIGRSASDHDFGGTAGVFHFPAMDGLNVSIKEEVVMHMGLTGDEIGYLVPESDVHDPKHPDYYEEDLMFGSDTETLYRATVLKLIQESEGK